MTPEEQLAEMKAKVAEFEAKGAQTEALQSKIAAMEKDNAERAARDKARDMDFALKESILENPSLKGMEMLIKGGTPEEVRATAKALAEGLKKREDEMKAAMGTNNAAAWGSIPQSQPNTFAIPKDRQDQYEAAKKIPNLRDRLVRLFQLKIEDLSLRHIWHERKKLGL